MLFKLKKCLWKGKYSDIFEVYSNNAGNGNQDYELDRYYLRSKGAVLCALRKHRIYRLISSQKLQSPFLTNQFYSTILAATPLSLIALCSPLNLSHLLRRYSHFQVCAATFFCIEIICGLDYLHKLCVVHMDIKPSNILLKKSGHIMITDFDSAFDMTLKRGRLQPEDFRGTPIYMAPEVSTRQEISFKSVIFNW